MHSLVRSLAVGLLSGSFVSCAHWPAPLPSSPSSTRTSVSVVERLRASPFSGVPDESPAEPAIEAPTPVEAAAAPEATTEPVAAEPTPEAPAPGPLVRGTSLLGSSAFDASGNAAGTVGDLLIDRATGEVVAVLTQPPPSSPEVWVRVLVYRGLMLAADRRPGVRVAAAESSSSHPRELAVLFDDQESVEVDGAIVELEPIDPARPEVSVVLLRDSDNLLHRLALEPRELIERVFAGLESGETLRAEGVETRDGRGKLLIVSSLTRGERSLDLRNDLGGVRWDDLVKEFLSARAFLKATIQPADGEPLAIVDWVLDRETGVISHVLFELANEPRALAWSSLERTKVGWRTALDRAALELLPAFRADVAPAAPGE